MRSPLIWLGTVIALLLLVLVVRKSGEDRGDSQPPPEVENTTPVDFEKQKSLALKPGTILHTVARFIAARSPEQYAGLIRDENKTLPKITAYFAENDGNPPTWTLSGVEKQIERRGDYAVVRLKGEKLPGSRLILQETDGNWLADWESFVVWQETPWEKITTDESPARIRASVSAHPKRAELFLLRDPLRNKTLTARLAKDSASEDLRALFEKRKKGAWILEVEPLPGSESEVVITGIIVDGWVDRIL